MAYVYIVSCEDSSLYTGITTDLCKRMKSHVKGSGSGSAKYMRSHKICEIMAVWVCDEYKVAAKLEYAIKRLKKSEKQELIENPFSVGEKIPKLSEYEFTPLSGVTLEGCLNGSFKERDC